MLHERSHMSLGWGCTLLCGRSLLFWGRVAFFCRSSGWSVGRRTSRRWFFGITWGFTVTASLIGTVFCVIGHIPAAALKMESRLRNEFYDFGATCRALFQGFFYHPLSDFKISTFLTGILVDRHREQPLWLCLWVSLRTLIISIFFVNPLQNFYELLVYLCDVRCSN